VQTEHGAKFVARAATFRLLPSKAHELVLVGDCYCYLFKTAFIGLGNAQEMYIYGLSRLKFLEFTVCAFFSCDYDWQLLLKSQMMPHIVILNDICGNSMWILPATYFTAKHSLHLINT
jgi:hypothetical protein